MPDEILITFELEPIVKLHCINTACKFNKYEMATCGLKQITIGDHGQCLEMESKEEKPKAE